MGIIGSYRDQDVWATSMDLVDDEFRHALSLPKHEFELRSQMKRAAISIPTNITEGWCRKDRVDRSKCGEIEQLMGRVRPMLNRLYDSI